MDDNVIKNTPTLSIAAEPEMILASNNSFCDFQFFSSASPRQSTQGTKPKQEREADDLSDDSDKFFSIVQFFECGVCAYDCPYDELFGLFFCDHKICNDCAVQHFEIQIKNYSLDNVVCPFPNCTDLSKKDDTQRQEYFAYLQVQLKDILHSDTVNLLDQKLLNLTLSDVDNFLWCPNCESGMISMNPDDAYVVCVGCQKPICPRCKQLWNDGHSGLTCEEYRAWKRDNDPVHQEKGLKEFLEKYGMECPKCKAQFVKSSGGCLHMSCLLCNHQFCEGCLQPFVQGEVCHGTTQCAKLGLHAHHPRNCFYFLRDWSAAQLQRLLDSNSIKYETKPLHENTKCPVFEQKELSNAHFVDEECNCEVLPENAGLCSKHYVQYLGRLVLKHKLDPLPEYPTADLEKLCAKHSLPLPPRDRNYHHQMLKNLLQLGLESAVATHTLLDDPTASLDEESDEEVGAVGGWMTGSNSHWACAFCTYLNEEGAPICFMCNRTKLVGEEGVDLWIEEGIECVRCTLINPVDATYCEACESQLPEVATSL